MSHLSIHARYPRRRRGRRSHLQGHGDSGIHRFFGHGRGGRAVRRGNVRFAILAVIQDRPMHGYEVIQELQTRTAGRWRPSAGSVYPTLQMLEDEGLLSSEEVAGRRTYSLTDAGRKTADEHPLTLETDADQDPSLPELAGRVIAAAAELDRVGTDDARRSARQLLVEARKRLYRLLAEDEPETTD